MNNFRSESNRNFSYLLRKYDSYRNRLSDYKVVGFYIQLSNIVNRIHFVDLFLLQSIIELGSTTYYEDCIDLDSINIFESQTMKWTCRQIILTISRIRKPVLFLNLKTQKVRL